MASRQQWMIIDTRCMSEAMQRLVDGYIHFLPHRTRSRHWVETACWCEPEVHWSDEHGTVIVRHHRKQRPTMEHVDG